MKKQENASTTEAVLLLFLYFFLNCSLEVDMILIVLKKRRKAPNASAIPKIVRINPILPYKKYGIIITGANIIVNNKIVNNKVIILCFLPLLLSIKS